MKKYNIKLLIRDDDVSYYTEPEIIERIYGDIWDKVPVYLSVIPRVYTGQEEVPVDIPHENEYMWVGDNEILVSFLKEKIKERKVYVWQHGFTHKNYGEKFELQRSDVDAIYNDLLAGKKHLEKVFGVKIDTIVPPHDSLSKAAILAIEKIGYDYIARGGIPSPREIPWTNIAYVLGYTKLLKFYLTKGRRFFRYPCIYRLGSHHEIYCYRINVFNRWNIDDILKFHNNGILCITMHHRATGLIHLEKLKLILSKINLKSGVDINEC